MQSEPKKWSRRLNLEVSKVWKWFHFDDKVSVVRGRWQEEEDGFSVLFNLHLIFMTWKLAEAAWPLGRTNSFTFQEWVVPVNGLWKAGKRVLWAPVQGIPQPSNLVLTLLLSISIPLYNQDQKSSSSPGKALLKLMPAPEGTGSQFCTPGAKMICLL